MNEIANESQEHPSPEGGQEGENQPQGKTAAMAVYILYIASVVFGLLALVGVITAYIARGNSDAIRHSHFTFQIRTFWIAILFGVISFALIFTVVLIPLAWIMGLGLFIWTLTRNIKGLMCLTDNKVIDNPTSWLFG